MTFVLGLEGSGMLDASEEGEIMDLMVPLERKTVWFSRMVPVRVFIMFAFMKR